jgi:hypothetical protein
MKFCIKLIFLLFLSFSCGKVFKTNVKGKVLNPVTGLGIENARVILQKAGGGLPAGLETVAFVYTDASGNFEISAKKLKSLTASVILDGNDYYSIGWKENGNDYSFLSPKKGEITEADFWAVPYGQMKIAIHNVNCQGENDELILEVISPVPYTAIVSPVSRYGCYSHPGTPIKVPMGNYQITWKVIRGNIEEVFNQNLFIPENGLGELTINY